MSPNIYVPRGMIDMLYAAPNQRNKCICVKIPYKGYEISVSMDSSHGLGDLARSDIRVYTLEGKDVTRIIYYDQNREDGTPHDVYGDADMLILGFQRIDYLVFNKALNKEPQG